MINGSVVRMVRRILRYRDDKGCVCYMVNGMLQFLPKNDLLEN